MQSIILHNFAGAGCNLVKYLTWTLIFDPVPSIRILFYYRNKMAANDDPKAIVLASFDDMTDKTKNIFYKLFEYPEGLSEKSFVEGSPIRLSFPTNLPLDFLPACLKNYPSMFPFNVHNDLVDLNFTSYAKFYSDPLLPEIRVAYFNQIEKNLRFRSEIQEEIQKELQVIQDIQKQGKTVLAIFLRSTNHYNALPFGFDEVLEESTNYINKYDYVLVSTQVKPTLELYKSEFGDRVLWFPRKRLDIDDDWKKDVSNEEFEEEVKMAIIDSYLMSQCDYLLSGISNMMLMSLFFNPHIPFSLFKSIKTEVSG